MFRLLACIVSPRLANLLATILSLHGKVQSQTSLGLAVLSNFLFELPLSTYKPARHQGFSTGRL